MIKNLLLFFSCFLSFAIFGQTNTRLESEHSLLVNAENSLPKGLLLKNANSQISCLIMVELGFDENKLRDIATIQSKAGTIWSVLVSEENVSSFIKIPGILAIEPATRVNSMRLQMDSARTTLGVNNLHQGQNFGLPQAFTGKDVIVGIVDIGFQHRHPAFYANDSTTLRISRVWQQNHDGGTAPKGYSYGTEYIGKDEIFNDLDLHGSHGTHVAGIAAGSGIGSPNLKFKGVAPESELVFVSIKYYTQDLPGSALSDYIIANPAIIDAYKYIFDYAKSQGKPAVINLSWGMHTGPHDGTSLFDLATNSLVGEGLILVGAAGNYGQTPMHFEHNFSGDTVKTILIENQRLSYPQEQIYVDMWGSGNSVFSVSVHLMDTFGNIVYESPYVSTVENGTESFSHKTDSGLFTADFLITSNYLPNSKPNNTLWINNPNAKLYLVGVSITSPFSKLHAWNSGGVYRYTSGTFVNKHRTLDLTNTYKAGNTDYTVGENGGTSKSVISVGATAAKNFYVGIFNDTFNNAGYVSVGSIAPFSSRGPTADGRIKPDILAPGHDVAAPIYLQQYPGWAWNRLVAREGFQNDTFAYGVFSGTSMAAPQVTGVIALMLQANPLLTTFQINQILRKTALVDNATGTVPNNNAGWGKINAFEAVKEALRILGTKQVVQDQIRLLVYPNPSNNILHIESETDVISTIEMYSIDGKRVFYQNLTEPTFNTQISVEALITGVYFLKVNGQIHRILVD